MIAPQAKVNSSSGELSWQERICNMMRNKQEQFPSVVLTHKALIPL